MNTRRSTIFAFSLLALLGLFFGLAACSSATPSSDQIQTAIAQTQAVAKVESEAATISPTLEPTATKTTRPTHTPRPTNTPRPTKTNTATPTITNTPPAPWEQTATSVQATSLAQATNAASTRQVAAATATEVATYTEINYRELTTYADKHAGEKVIVRGRIFNIVDDTTFQIFFAGTYEAAVIMMSEAFSDLYEDQSVTVYAIVGGKDCFSNAYGAETCQPVLVGMFYTKP